MTEHHEQAAVVEWFKLRWPKHENLIWANLNGAILCDLGTSDKRLRRMVHLEQEGYKKGVSDLFIAVPTPHYHGLFLEMKDRGKKLIHVTKQQRDHLNDVQLMGYAGAWAAGFDAARVIVEGYMGGQKL